MRLPTPSLSLLRWLMFGLVVLVVAFAVWVASVSNTSSVSANDNSELISDIYDWRDARPANGIPSPLHIDRWNRVLLALGEDVDVDSRMYSTEAQVYADRGWTRWVRVLEALKQVETANAVVAPQYDACNIRIAGIVYEPPPPAIPDPDNPQPKYILRLQWSGLGAGCEATTLRLDELYSGSWSEYLPDVSRFGDYTEGISAAGLKERTFRLVASDGRVSNTATVGAAGFAPRNIWVQADRYLGIVVNWDAAPGSGGWATDYRVEWRDSEGTIKSALKGGNAVTNHRIVGVGYQDFVPVLNGNLVEGEAYTIRVVAVSGTGDDADEVASVWSNPVTTYHDPLKVWFGGNSPTFNANVSRVFMTVNTTAHNASANCRINGGGINCPPNTLISLDVFAGGKFNIIAEARSSVTNPDGTPHYQNAGVAATSTQST